MSLKHRAIIYPGCWRRSELITIIRQLATLLQAGLPLVRAIALIAQNHNSVIWRYLLRQIQKQVSQGELLSTTFNAYPNVFPPLFCQWMHLGETTGELGFCCQTLADQQERSLALRQQIFKVIRYPCFVLVSALLLTALLLIFVLPEFASVYEAFDASLPYLTEKLLTLSEWLQNYAISLFVGLFIVFLGYRYFCHPKPYWQRWEQNCLLSIPFLGTLLQKSHLARLFHTLFLSQRAGVSLVESLNMTADSIGHHAYRKALLSMRMQVEIGSALSDSLRQCALFPPLSRQFIQIGEESGTLESMLEKLAEIYTKMAEDDSEKLVGQLGPILMLLLAIVVGTMVLAIYLPIFQMGQIIT